MVSQRINPSNPEAALLDWGGRPSMEWIQFALEELTGLRFRDGALSKAFSRLANRAGWIGSSRSRYIEKKVSSSINVIDPVIDEAEAIIERMI